MIKDITKIECNNSYPNFKENFEITDKRKKEFIDFVQTKDSDLIIDNLEDINWVFIKGRIKSQVASNIWGKEYLYRTSIDSDPVIIKAIDSFSEIDNIFNKK